MFEKTPAKPRPLSEGVTDFILFLALLFFLLLFVFSCIFIYKYTSSFLWSLVIEAVAMETEEEEEEGEGGGGGGGSPPFPLTQTSDCEIKDES